MRRRKSALVCFCSVHLGHLALLMRAWVSRRPASTSWGRQSGTAEITNAGSFTAELYRFAGDLLVQLGRLYEAEIDLQRGLTTPAHSKRPWGTSRATSIARMWLDRAGALRAATYSLRCTSRY